jgi:hypothetical protein
VKLTSVPTCVLRKETGSSYPHGARPPLIISVQRSPCKNIAPLARFRFPPPRRASPGILPSLPVMAWALDRVAVLVHGGTRHDRRAATRRPFRLACCLPSRGRRRLPVQRTGAHEEEQKRRRRGGDAASVSHEQKKKIASAQLATESTRITSPSPATPMLQYGARELEREGHVRPPSLLGPRRRRRQRRPPPRAAVSSSKTQ